MCAVSNMGDMWSQTWTDQKTSLYPSYPQVFPTGPTQNEFNDLKKEVEALRKLLEAAKQYDQETGRPDCEMDDKVALIKEVAKVVGVDMSKIFK